ncbi:MAG TPA: hypothetical protein VG368_01785 [Acidimicrobiales bacterium]|nr:hypothetical protein [Acidimicrobiales bacterium]
MPTRTLRKGIAGAALSATALIGVSSVSAFASMSHPSFSVAQQELEQQLANRVTSLGHLASDVTSAGSSLTATHAAVLSARISAELANMNALVAKVPNDTTNAQLNTDRAAMVRDNRVYAVMTPQVFETIAADTYDAQINKLAADEPVLAAEVASLVGQPGSQTATRHYEEYLNRVGNEATKLSNLIVSILAQQPSSYPANRGFFVSANHQIRNAGLQIANANYDATVIALASGGYTGS